VKQERICVSTVILMGLGTVIHNLLMFRDNCVMVDVRDSNLLEIVPVFMWKLIPREQFPVMHCPRQSMNYNAPVRGNILRFKIIVSPSLALSGDGCFDYYK
jgi:hypothetical protein